MTPDQADPAPDDIFADRLADLDDAIAGANTPTGATPTGLSDRLKRGLVAIKALQQLRPGRALLAPTRSGFDATLGEIDRGPAPRQLGRFDIIRELGRGGFGIVFLAHDPRLKRDVAIKVPHTAALIDDTLRERFRREAQAAAGLNHPHIVGVYELDEQGPICALVSVYCPGINLASWLSRQTVPVPSADAAELVADLADAVAYAHERGVVHRDLKPANILLTDQLPKLPENGGGKAADRHTVHWQSSLPSFAARISDFGLAKLDGDSTGMTKDGAVLGTPAYMAPEQARGKTAEVDARADVYALGAVLYELLTGRPPFRGESDVDTIKLVCDAEPVAPRQLRPKLPKDLETISLKCLQKDPARRYATAAQLRDDLQRFQRGEPIKARPVSRSARIVRWCRRKPAIAGLTAALFFAVLGGLVGMAVGYTKASHERDAAVIERDRADRLLGHAHKMLARFQVIGEELRTRTLTQKQGRELLQETLKYYQTLLTEAADDPKLRRDVAKAAHLAATTLRDTGRNDEAEAIYRQGLASFDLLLATAPNDTTLIRDRASSAFALASLLSEGGRLTEARALYRPVGEVYAQLASGPDGEIEDRRMQLSSMLSLGQIINRQDGPESGMPILHSAVDQLRTLAAAAPKNRDVRNNFAVGLDLLSANCYDASDFAEAERFARESIAVYQKLLNEMTSSTSSRIGLAKGYTRLANTLHAANRTNEAIDLLRVAAPLYERLARNAPSNAVAHRDYGNHLWLYCDMLENQKRYKESGEQFQKAIAVYEHLISIQPTVYRWKADAARTMGRAGNAAYRIKDYRMARTLVDRLREFMLKITPPPADWAELFRKITEDLDRLDRAIVDKEKSVKK